MNGLFKSMVVDRPDMVAYPGALDLFFDFVGAGRETPVTTPQRTLILKLQQPRWRSPRW